MGLGPVESLDSELNYEGNYDEVTSRVGESSSSPVSYVPQCEFDDYLRDQRKQKAWLKNLEKIYAGLAKSNSKLSISHSKMKKREKNRYKFFTGMWKGVIGLWKVLKENEPLPTLRPNKDGNDPATRIDDERPEDSEAIESGKD
ncbi:hypothetical protein RDI58_019955 [Solanum bulbocastanum]|uniref:Uncharacterized protein n=1 Tax=Solanum bulbocastanum TaxID=147425 RepID=A0AAN8T691_SOLBU